MAVALAGSEIAYPIVSAIHIAAIGILLGAIVTLDLRLLGVFRAHPVAHLAPPLVSVAGAGLVGAVLSGALLFSTRPAAYAANPAFLAKLALIGIGLLNVLILRLNPRWRAVCGGAPVPVSIAAAVLVSLLVWSGALLAGRWIGFLQ